MNRLPGMLLVWFLLGTGVVCSPSPTAWGAESAGQERLAYAELVRVRSLAAPGAAYGDYRDAMVRAREYVGLLKDGSSATVQSLVEAMDYYEEALTVWALQADSDFPVDSMRTDEPNGAAVLAQCPGIARFHYKERDQVYVQDALACLWRKAAQELAKVPVGLR